MDIAAKAREWNKRLQSDQADALAKRYDEIGASELEASAAFKAAADAMGVITRHLLEAVPSGVRPSRFLLCVLAIIANQVEFAQMAAKGAADEFRQSN